MVKNIELEQLVINKLTQEQFDNIEVKNPDELYFVTDAENDGGKGAQVEEMPEATEMNAGQIVQYVGETNDTYTNGYFYKCTETDGVYSWTQVNVQEGGGGDYLPLSGGTLTGPLEISQTAPYDSYNLYFLRLKNVGPNTEKTLNIGYNGRTIVIDNAGIRQAGDIEPANEHYNLGSVYARWGKVYTTKISWGTLNGVVGGDLIVPTEGGTLARVEDIDAAVGDISTALTAILGE